MKIKNAEYGKLEFDNGMTIIGDYCPDCYWNYADFTYLDSWAHDYNFDPDLLKFEKNEYGFSFGDHPSAMFFVPCYSSQSGCYESEVNILFNNKRVFRTDCKLI